MWSVVNQLLVGLFLLFLFLPDLSLHSLPASDLGLGGRSVLCMQQVAQQSAHLFACVVVCDFDPFTLCELAKVSIRLMNDFDNFRNDDSFGCFAVSPRVPLYEHASENAEATVSDMIETVSSATANDGKVG
jgi:hypothetical protein